jgi:hypothetical protein
MKKTCHDCVRFWRDYTRAVYKGSQLDAQAHLASLRGAHRAATSLLSRVRDCEVLVAALRQKLIRHHSAVHEVRPAVRPRSGKR